MKKSNNIKKLNQILGDEITLEAVQEVIDRMLINIYFGSEVATEIMFASNCLETVLDKDFTEDQEIQVYMVLIKIVKKYF